MKKLNLGQHYLADYYQCQGDGLNDQQKIREIVLEAARLANATVVGDAFHQLDSQGISAILVNEKSHFVIHTWPEHNFAAVDIFTCGAETKPYLALDYLKRIFNAHEMKLQIIDRG